MSSNVLVRPRTGRLALSGAQVRTDVLPRPYGVPSPTPTSDGVAVGDNNVIKDEQSEALVLPMQRGTTREEQTE